MLASLLFKLMIVVKEISLGLGLVKLKQLKSSVVYSHVSKDIYFFSYLVNKIVV